MAMNDPSRTDALGITCLNAASSPLGVTLSCKKIGISSFISNFKVLTPLFNNDYA